MEKVSVIIPTYKRSKFLKRALESVLQQTYKNIEIIVIDDNIIDSNYRLETEAIMKEYEKNTNVFYLKNSENIGGALSRNKGIKASSGEFIAFLDDDDEYVFDKIEKQYNFYKEKFGDNNGIVFCQTKFYNEAKKTNKTTNTKISNNKEAMYMLLKSHITSTGTLFLKKNMICEIKGFKKVQAGQEWLLMLELLGKGYQIYSMPEVLLKYYIHGEERISTNVEKKLEATKYLYEISQKYIEKFSEHEKKELHYLNNILLVLYSIKAKKKGAMKYFKIALSYKCLKLKDFLKIVYYILT